MDFRLRIIVRNLSGGDRFSDTAKQDRLLRALTHAAVGNPDDKDERIEIHFITSSSGKDQAIGLAAGEYARAFKAADMAGPSTMELAELDGENVTQAFLKQLGPS